MKPLIPAPMNIGEPHTRREFTRGIVPLPNTDLVPQRSAFVSLEDHVRRCSTAQMVGQQWLDLCPDEIEQRIIRAYVQLVFAASDSAGSRTIVVARFGSVDVRLTELPQGDGAGHRPLFCMAIYSQNTGSILDSCECSEFDESELTAAVELMLKAKRRYELYH